MTKNSAKAVGLTLLLLATSPVPGIAADVAKPTKASETAVRPSGIDPFSEQLIKAVSDLLVSAERVQFHADVTEEHVLSTGQKVMLSRSVDVVMRRPDRLRADVVTDDGRRRFYYDGQTLSMHHLEGNAYATLDVPSNIDEMVDAVQARFGIAMPLVDLLVSDAYANYKQNADTSAYLGLHQLRGIEHHHLLLSNENVDYQVWIEDARIPLIRKIVLTHTNRPGLPQFTAEMTQWDLDAATPDIVFAFQPPADAEQIEVLPVDRSVAAKGGRE